MSEATEADKDCILQLREEVLLLRHAVERLLMLVDRIDARGVRGVAAPRHVRDIACKQ